MTGFLSVEVSNTVPISLQLIDGNENQYPQAEIRDNDETLLTIIDLSHSVAGVYFPSTFYTMPDVDFIIITYKIYINSGHSTESDKYMRDTDIFYKSIIETNTESLSGNINTEFSDVNIKLDEITTNTEGISGNIDLAQDKLDRIMGLVHNNTMIDQAKYDTYGNLASARMRIYSHSASVGTDNNVIGEYEIKANGTAIGKFSYWQQKRVDE